MSNTTVAADPQRRFVEANGTRFHYLDWGGSGPTCIMIHGSGLGAGSWAPVAERLRGRFHCLAPDLRGHGRSGGADAGISWGLIAQDVAAIVTALDLRDTWVVAHSRGASSTLLSNLYCADRYAFQVLVEPSILMRLNGPGEPPFSNSRLVEASRRQRSSYANRDEMRAALLQRRSFQVWDPAVLEAYLRYCVEDQPDGSVQLACSPDTQTRYLQAAVDVDIWRAVEQIRCPVLLGVAEQPSLFKEQAWAVQRFKATVDCTTVKLPGDHFTPLQHPAHLAEAVLAFARERAGVGAAG